VRKLWRAGVLALIGLMAGADLQPEPEGVTHLKARGLLVTTNEVDGSITVICVSTGSPCR
jgi:hypothetical protein